MLAHLLLGMNCFSIHLQGAGTSIQTPADLASALGILAVESYHSAIIRTKL